MNKYVISCCSTADLSKEHFEKINVKYIYFHYEIDGEEKADDLGETMAFDEFYQKMADGAMTKTSQVNAEEFEEFFENFLKEGYDIIHVTLSSGISGVLNSANIAKDILSDKYPERKIYVVDSLGASSGYGLLMDKMAEKRDEGLSIDELYKWTEENKLYVQSWFFSTDLTFYIRGGRISKASGAIGTVLGICPLLCINDKGKLIPKFKIRTKKKVIRTIVEKMEEFAKDRLDYADKCYISHSACMEDAIEVAKLVENKFPKLKGHVDINWVGTTIGSHTGPGTVALFFWGDKRSE
ncbi:EDD domain protein, DegV family [Acetitomaculum ruminis DSM 5522]|uniref:EDD domain protein, DegV family n=1 Tax=Acetitomaculum ruminis DSM 5522 TaxID=1120918 RepID=A0A1I0WNI6_9FIRM|nr:DegV family protein [Acetitomaculum ruminis]SFA90309.1 EDD domain protein, DegV family [Acetitomaculum ruminis DSM 5522]